MESFVLINALKLVLHISYWIFGFIFLGALFSAIIRVVTQIEDPLLAFIGKFTAFVCLFYFYGDNLSRKVMQFALRIWSSNDFYQ